MKEQAVNNKEKKLQGIAVSGHVHIGMTYIFLVAQG